MTQQLSILFLLLKVLLSVLPLNDVSIARQERLEHLMMEHKRMGDNTRRLATACQKTTASKSQVSMRPKQSGLLEIGGHATQLISYVKPRFMTGK